MKIIFKSWADTKETETKMQNEIDIREDEMKIEIFKITEEDVTIRTTIIPHEKKNSEQK